MSKDMVEIIVEAIWLRDECRKGLQSPEWIKAQALRQIEIGLWNDSQIAELVGYERQTVSAWHRTSGAVRPVEAIGGGRLAVGALDAILALLGEVRRGAEPNQLVLQAAISTGTSTKLISRLTGISLGVVLYAQRKLKNTKENDHGM